jgi:hypothetical protein
VLQTVNGFPTFKAVNDARYLLNVTGGVSGNFSVVVTGRISGLSVILAGITAIASAGQYTLFPIGYSNSGTVLAVPTAQNLSEMLRYDTIVPPSHAQFIANTSTAGVSANCTIVASLYGGH